jgi:HNH endonuclease/AP2 domain
MIALRTNAESAIRNGTETMLKHRPSLTTTRKDRAMATKPDITPELLRQLIRFDEVSGEYFWVPRPRSMFKTNAAFMSFNSRFAGKPALNTSNGLGYLRSRFFGARHQAHRVVWAYHYGEWPEFEIDHINGNRADNRIENLRAVNAAANMQNKKVYRNNKSGVSGVFRRPTSGRWQVSIAANGKRIGLGTYECFEEAVAVRKAAEVTHGFHANHGKR